MRTRPAREPLDAARLGAAFLLDFARGALILDADLVEAVRSKTIAGAVLDVFRKEPLPADHPFWTTEGIVVLPHIGGAFIRRATKAWPRCSSPTRSASSRANRS